MENLKVKITTVEVFISDTENQKGVKNHLKIAAHFQAAAKNHLKAAKYHQQGNHKQAAQNTMAAYGHVSLAEKAQRKDVRQHAMNG